MNRRFGKLRIIPVVNLLPPTSSTSSEANCIWVVTPSLVVNRNSGPLAATEAEVFCATSDSDSKTVKEIVARASSAGRQGHSNRHTHLFNLRHGSDFGKLLTRIRFFTEKLQARSERRTPNAPMTDWGRCVCWFSLCLNDHVGLRITARKCVESN